MKREPIDVNFEVVTPPKDQPEKRDRWRISLIPLPVILIVGALLMGVARALSAMVQ